MPRSRQLVDLEYTSVEVMIHETGGHPGLHAFGGAGRRGAGRDALPADAPPDSSGAESLDIQAPEPEYYHQFAACCRLAKAIKVVTVTVRSGELGTPFNAEVERLRTFVSLASQEGVRVGLLTEVGRMSENPDTAVVMCDSVKGLGITLDPSHYIYGPHGGATTST